VPDIAASLHWLDRLFREEHQQLQRRIGRWLGSTAAAEDAVQDAFLRMATSAAAAQAQDPPAYLARAARHAAIDRLRRKADGRQDGEALTEQMPCPLPAPDVAAAQRQRIRHFTAALQRLPQRQQQMVVAARVEGLSYAAIAARHGSTPAAVEKAVSRALQRLEAVMAMGDGPSP
jgi:RNA polymerase sigma factor (sigma-70 family)